MRIVKIEKTILKFNELNKKEKSKVLDNYRDINIDHDWWDSSHDYVKRILSFLGFYEIRIYHDISNCQGSGANFTGKFTPHVIRNKIDDFKINFGDCSYFKLSEQFLKISESWNEEEEVYHVNTRYCHENCIKGSNGDLNSWAKEFSRLIYKELQEEYESLINDESVKETLIINEYEFDKDTLKIYKE